MLTYGVSTIGAAPGLFLVDVDVNNLFQWPEGTCYALMITYVLYTYSDFDSWDCAHLVCREMLLPLQQVLLTEAALKQQEGIGKISLIDEKGQEQIII